MAISVSLLCGTGVTTNAGATLSPTPPTTQGGNTDLLCLMAGARTLGATYSATPAGYTTLKQGTGNDTRSILLAKIAGPSEAAPSITSAGTYVAQCFVLRLSGATWTGIGSIVKDSVATSGNLTATSTVTQFCAITPSVNNLLVIRVANRNVSTSTSATAIAASSNFTNTDGTHPLFTFFNNGGSGILLAGEIWLQGTATTAAQANDTVTGMSDTTTSNCSQLAVTLQITGGVLSGLTIPNSGGF